MNHNTDPISYLEINTEQLAESEVEELRQVLLKDINEFLLLKLTKDLTDAQIEELIHLDETIQIDYLRQFLPDFDIRLNNFLEQFKTEFNSTNI